jgi:V8-like Glu-specific endopeptidase
MHGERNMFEPKPYEDKEYFQMKNRKRSLIVVFAVLAIMLGIVGVAAAITEGELDGTAHPHVVLLLMEVDGEPAFRCSGTLIAPTYLLTAGHCAGAPGEFSGMRVFTDSDVEGGIGITNNYPYGGLNSVEAVRWAAHPLYPTAPFFVHDVGMVELAEPIDLDEYGTLPAVDQLDALKTKRGQHKTWFTAVGYGLQRINPVFVEAERVRMFAEPRLIQINTPGFTGDFSLLLSNNHSTGGTCFGDSGGPNFLGDSNIVAGVTSFGINGNCAGTGGVFRMDRQNVQDFVNDFMNP